MTALPSRDFFDSLIDPERLFVVPDSPKVEHTARVVAEAQKLGLDLDRPELLYAGHHGSRHSRSLRIQQDLRITLDDCDLEADGTLVLRQELRLGPGCRGKHHAHPHPTLTQTDGQIWLYGPGAAYRGELLKAALHKLGIEVATSHVYRVARRPKSRQRYGVDPWHVGVMFNADCEDVEALRKSLDDLLKIDRGKGPWHEARVREPGDMYELAVKFRKIVQGRARLTFRPVPLVLPVAAVPPELTTGTYGNQRPNFNLISAEAMWSSVQAWNVPPHPLQQVSVFLIDCGVYPSADVIVDGRSRLIDCPTGPGTYLSGSTPIGGNPHGTQMAGTACATWATGGIAGITGVAGPGVIQLVSLRCVTLLHIRNALAYAAANLAGGKGVVLMGLDMLRLYCDAAWCPAFLGEAEQFSAALSTATSMAAGGGNLLVITPSGNYDPTDPEDGPTIPMPVPSDLTGTVVVGACNAAGDARWVDPTFPGGSLYGPDVSLVAPGVNVWSTTGAATYGYGTGTSFAAAHAGGVAALMRSINTALSPQVLKARMTAGANVSHPPPASPEVGAGRLNGVACVDAAKLP